MTNRPQVTIYTDGGAQPNPGPGGYGILQIFANPARQRELSGGEPDTTNNRMELTAACIALESLTEPHDVTLYTDSEYVKKGITEWIAGWVRKGWKDVKNPDLWQRLYKATLRHEINWKWVRGHAGNVYNERVDQLATAGRTRVKQTGRVVTAEPVEQAVVSETAVPTLGAAKFDFVIYTATDFDSKTKQGGWAAVIESNGTGQELSGAERNTSEYQLALLAAVKALSALTVNGSVQFHTESETVAKGASQWIKGWRKNGWKNAQGKPVVHQDLWQQLDEIIQKRTIVWKEAHGASSRADALAKSTRLTLKS